MKRACSSRARSSRSGGIDFTSERRVELGELRVEAHQHVVDELADLAQRMIGRNSLFQVDIREQLARPRIRTPHPRLLCWPGKQESCSPKLVSWREVQQPARADSGHWVTSLSQTLCWIARDPRCCADRPLARCVQVAIKGLGGMDVRRGPMHNDRVSTGSRLQDHDHAE